MQQRSKNNKEVAIKVENLSKSFRVPHEKHTSLKAAALNMFRKKKYTEFQALKDINFEIKKGEFFGIIGRNGSGKSTLLKILAGIYVPDSGKITINGKLSPFLELGVGFNPELTGRENLYLGGSILGLSREQVGEKYEKIVEFAELEDFIDMKLKNYSSGMQVRLAFSLSINVHAEILLMDEVLAVGDNNFQAKCLEEFRKYRKDGKTVLLISHDINTIQRYCDRALLLRNGIIEKIGSATGVVDSYINQNIEDNETITKKEDDGTKNISKKEKKVEIVSLGFAGMNDEKKKSFRTGESLIMKIKLSLKRKKLPVNIGVGIYREDGSYVLGCNTMMDGHKIIGDSVEIIFDELQLLKGTYYVNVVCFGDFEEKFYDFKSSFGTFRVFPTVENDKYRGIINLSHTWS
jgi:ABC-2 type transport system ATP-binding protein